VLEVDRERRRFKLGIKQLEPTTADEYIAEHQIGESVTGRIVEANKGRAKIELGEGVFAECRMREEGGNGSAAGTSTPEPAAAKADLGSLTAMLSAKWKQGPAQATQSEAPKAGQVRTFRILKLDQANKKIEVELAG
jgi:small subunit ribosomal protein S1